jgi:hypothetical protein
MRTTLIRIWVAAAALALTGCADDDRDADGSADASPTNADAPPTSGATTHSRVVTLADDPLLTCGSGPAFAAAAIDGGVSGLADEGEVEAALDDLRALAGIDAPEELQEHPASEAAWMVLGGDPADHPRSIMVGIGRWDAQAGPVDGDYVILERGADGWKAIGWGGCSPAPVAHPGTAWVEVHAAPGGLDPQSTEVDVLVNEIECASGRDPSPFLHEPTIVEQEDAVIVYWTSDAPAGNQTCQGNPGVRRTLELDEPIGDRRLFDGSSWPPAPIRGF